MNRQPHHGAPGDSDPSQRLDGWKEIATYLKRDVRTIQRWEQQEGLPIHRHFHKRRGSVFAYVAELDVWWHARDEPPPDSEAPAQRTWHSRILTPATILAVLLSLAFLGSWYLNNASVQDQAFEFREREWVLVAPFDNRTGESFLDGTIQYALARELSNSRFVNIVPRMRIEDTLQLMQKPPDIPIDRVLAREICLRDGAIRAYLTGRVERLGSRHVLWAELVDPAGNATIASWSETVEAEEEFWPKIRRLSQSIREGLGESITQGQQRPRKLAEVTTPSLRALRLFSEGDALLHRGQPGASAQLFERALEEDPSFAAAHMWLAFALRNSGRPRSEWLPHVEQAVHLSDYVSEVERLVILAKAQSIQGKLKPSVPLYEALLQLDPDHFWGTNNLMWIYSELGRLEDMIRIEAQLSRIRPNNASAPYVVAYALANQRFDFERASGYQQRARQLFREQPDVASKYPGRASWIELFPVLRLLAAGQPAKARTAAAELESKLATFPGSVRELIAERLGAFQLTLAQVDKARELFAQLQDSDYRTVVSLTVAFLQGEEREAEELALKVLEGRYRLDPVMWSVLIRKGNWSQVEEMLVLSQQRNQPDYLQQFLTGEIAVGGGDFEGGLESLLSAFEDSARANRWPSYLAADSVARIYEKRGEPLKAVRFLERLDDPRRLINPWCGPFWLRNRRRLIQLYERLGMEREKMGLQADLNLFLADPETRMPIPAETTGS